MRQAVRQPQGGREPESPSAGDVPGIWPAADCSDDLQSGLGEEWELVGGTP